MDEKLYLYPIWVRLWHWINAFLCLLLILTGISMQYSDPEYPIIRFDWAVSIHDISGIVLTFSYISFVIGNIFTTNGRQYIFRIKGYWRKVSKQIRYYAFGIFTKEEPPFEITDDNKFNPLQRFSYVFIMYICMPVIIVTGFMLLYPDFTLMNIFGSTGLHSIDIIHVIMGFLISLFFVVHIYFCTIGANPLSNFKSMVNGYHDKH
ncbi:MAG: cytochrome b/b6 domain-containing protein [Bacteroidota bacterium]